MSQWLFDELEVGDAAVLARLRQRGEVAVDAVVVRFARIQAHRAEVVDAELLRAEALPADQRLEVVDEGRHCRLGIRAGLFEKPTGAETQRRNAGATFACTWVRFRGGLWRVVLTPEQWATYHRETL